MLEPSKDIDITQNDVTYFSYLIIVLIADYSKSQPILEALIDNKALEEIYMLLPGDLTGFSLAQVRHAIEKLYDLGSDNPSYVLTVIASVTGTVELLIVAETSPLFLSQLSTLYAPTLKQKFENYLVERCRNYANFIITNFIRATRNFLGSTQAIFSALINEKPLEEIYMLLPSDIADKDLSLLRFAIESLYFLYVAPEKYVEVDQLLLKGIFIRNKKEELVDKIRGNTSRVLQEMAQFSNIKMAFEYPPLFQEYLFASYISKRATRIISMIGDYSQTQAIFQALVDNTALEEVYKLLPSNIEDKNLIQLRHAIKSFHLLCADPKQHEEVKEAFLEGLTIEEEKQKLVNILREVTLNILQKVTNLIQLAIIAETLGRNSVKKEQEIDLLKILRLPFMPIFEHSKPGQSVAETISEIFINNVKLVLVNLNDSHNQIYLDTLAKLIDNELAKPQLIHDILNYIESKDSKFYLVDDKFPVASLDRIAELAKLSEKVFSYIKTDWLKKVSPVKAVAFAFQVQRKFHHFNNEEEKAEAIASLLADVNIMQLSGTPLKIYFMLCGPMRQKKLLESKLPQIRQTLLEIPAATRLIIASDHQLLDENMDDAFLGKDVREIINFLKEKSYFITNDQRSFLIRYIISLLKEGEFSYKLKDLALRDEKCALALISYEDWQKVISSPVDFLYELCCRYSTIREQVEKNNALKIILNSSTKYSQRADRHKIAGDIFPPSLHKYSLKVKLVGDSKVGKSSLILRYAEGRYIKYTERVSEALIGSYLEGYSKEEYCSQIKFVNFEDKYIALEVKESSKYEHFQGPHRDRDPDLYILVFDVTNPLSFDYVKYQEIMIRQNALNAICVLVATKTDQKNDRLVEPTTAQTWADSLNMPYIETSAKENVHIEAAFEMGIPLVWNKWMQQHPPESELESQSSQPKEPSSDQSLSWGSRSHHFRAPSSSPKVSNTATSTCVASNSPMEQSSNMRPPTCRQ